MKFPWSPSDPDTSEPPKRAFVLSGGGPRGAMQVGALRALWEAGIQPDMIVGTSIGAINGAFLARFGFNEEGLARLEEVWEHAARGDFAPEDFKRAMLRVLLPGFSGDGFLAQARAFYSRHGITPDLTFGELTGVEFYVIAADIRHHRRIIFGEDPHDRVLDCMLASAAIPPWLPPLPMGGGIMVDGGAVSDLPIEPALLHGATEIFALDLFHPKIPNEPVKGLMEMMDQIITTMEQRHIDLELELAQLLQVPVHRWYLRYSHPIPMWDLSHTHDLMHVGYEKARAYLAAMEEQRAIGEEDNPISLRLEARWKQVWAHMRARWEGRKTS